VLDLFLLVQLREEVFSDESSLHLDREDSLRDLFGFMQPRARLEDLMRDFGCNAGLVYTLSSTHPREGSSQDNNPSSSPSTSRHPSALSPAHSPSAASLRANTTAPLALHRNAVPFESISISFSIRRIGIVLSSQGGRKRTIVEIPRDRTETLERCASHLIYELKSWADAAHSTGR